MIVDASALLAVMFEEAGGDHYSVAMLEAGQSRIPAPTYVEATLAFRRLGTGQVTQDRFERTMVRLGLVIASFDAPHAEAARTAVLRYGKGSGHRAQLNFCDCLVYGFAKVEGEPLLFKGDDFSKTDIVSALPA